MASPPRARDGGTALARRQCALHGYAHGWPRAATGIRRSGSDATLLLIMNSHHEVVNFFLPEVAQGSGWTCLVDTSRPEERSSELYEFNSEFAVTSRSLLLFELQR